MAWRLLTVLLAGLCGGCGLLGPPSWVDKNPVDAEYYYGVGSAGVTFDGDPERSREIARQRALDELTRQIRVQVTATTMPMADQETGVPPGETLRLTEEDIEGVELVEVWVDDWGRAGKSHQTYVLVRLPRERVRAIASRPR